MAAYPPYRICNTPAVILVILVFILAATPTSSGARCRFASSSASQGQCIFPCKCTVGCNSTTGDCINGGRCIEDHPPGYRWSGPACQIGNIAYHKSATQMSYTWGDQFPAGRAVDGNVDQWRSHEHCALPGRGQGSNAWWQVDLGGMYNVLRVEIYTGNNKCQHGHFGAQCQFQCNCRSGETCNDITGKCSSDCPPDGWGVGCMLNNEHAYNDPRAFKYMGKRSSSTNGVKGEAGLGARSVKKCVHWTNKIYNIDRTFPDGSREAAKDYCRNPENEIYAWCYIKNDHNWAWCVLENIKCVAGRFDVNCVKECHCSNATEDCQGLQGGCQNGCAPHYTGSTCQDCADGYFGELCDRTCHCSSGVCNKSTGHCPSGCADDWKGDSCQTDSRGRIAFTLSVGNSPDRTSHNQCAVHRGEVADGAVVNKSCTSIGRYVSFQRTEGDEPRLTALCEVVVIGHPHISCDNCPSTCNNVIGCEACEPGKQQPDCSKDCTNGYYGVNCEESCGHCKNKSSCDITNGDCKKSCEPWYAPPLCTTYIQRPYFESSNKPTVKDITNSSATVTWPKARNISVDVRSVHYIYKVLLDAAGKAEKNTSQIVLRSDNGEVEKRIPGLSFNTNYTVVVQPYRQLDGKLDGGKSTQATKFKTNCRVPDIPVIKQVFVSPPNSISNATLYVTYKSPRESGCDDIASMRVWYKRQDAATSIWSYTKVHAFNGNLATVTVPTYGTYEVKVTATNNKNISATSNIVTNIGTVSATTPVSTSPTYSKEAVTAGRCLGAGVVTGIAVGTLLLGVIVTTVAMICIQKMREGPSNAAKQKQDAEITSSLKTAAVAESSLTAQHLPLTSGGHQPAVATAELAQTGTTEGTYQGLYQTVPEVNRNGDEYEMIRPAKGVQGHLNETSYVNIKQHEHK